MSRRVALLMTVAGMAVMALALAGTAWATGGGNETPPGGSGAPTVVQSVPEDGAMDVALDANIKAKFSEEMKERSINTNTFYLEVAGGCEACLTTTTKVPATVRYNDDTKTAVLNPTDPLAPKTTYTATVEGTGDGDMQAVKDKGGTPLATDFTFSFTTGSGAPCELC